ncbi:MAG: hypothetical protein IKF41_02800 [Alphaproteobacteria bacterium]|nr:hypothetical protein [Alphaproteobacteria bacterium]
MQQQAHTIAQRLLNLYRQAHVIEGGWAAVNKVFIAESNDAQVITELENLPTGKRLVAHINNLRSGKTPMDSIDKDLLPYGGLMSGATGNVSLTKEEIKQLKQALDSFQPTTESLDVIKNLPFVKKFGNDWVDDIRSAIAFDNDMLTKWRTVAQTDKAYKIWNSAKELLSETLTERNRAQIQADMLEYETYLPMFGDAGKEVLSKLRTFMSSLS